MSFLEKNFLERNFQEMSFLEKNFLERRVFAGLVKRACLSCKACLLVL